MKRRTHAAILLLIVVLFISFLSLACAAYNYGLPLTVPKVNAAETAAFSTFQILNAKGPGPPDLLNQTTRMEIYNFIKENPGVHFRALSRILSMPVGVLQYHLGLLVNGGFLCTYRDGRYKRYFESRRFSEIEAKVISCLRHSTSGKILVSLSQKPEMAHKELAANLGVSSQALTWQMNRLEKADLVKRSVEAQGVRYSLNEAMTATVSTYAAFLGN